MVLAFPGLIPVRKYRSVRTVLTHRLYVVSRKQQPSVYLILIELISCKFTKTLDHAFSYPVTHETNHHNVLKYHGML